MKIALLLTFIISITPLLSAGDISIRTNEEKTFINDFEFIHNTSTIKELIKEVGSEHKGAIRKEGSTYIFDELGISASINSDDLTIDQINVFLTKKPVIALTKQPKKLFKGKIIFRGIPITATTSYSEFAKDLHQKNLISDPSDKEIALNVGTVKWWFYPEGTDKKMVPGENMGLITLWESF